MVSELFRIAVRRDPEWCPDWFGMLSGMRRNSRFTSGVTLEKLPGFRLDSAVRMNRGNREMETSMAQKRLTMRQIHEILRLKYQNQISLREIARSCKLAVSTVGDYLKRAEAASLSWPLPAGMGEEELIQLLFGGSPQPPTQDDPSTQHNATTVLLPEDY